MKMRLWWAYFFFMLWIFLGSLGSIFSHLEAKYIAGHVITALQLLWLISLFGFCYGVKVGARIFWKVSFFSVFVAIFQFANGFLYRYSHFGEKGLGDIVGAVIVFFMFSPSWVAMYRYAFKRDDIWAH